MNERNRVHKNWFEWLVFALGVLLTTGTIVFLGYQAWTQTSRPSPHLEVALGAPSDTAGGVVVPVTVSNRGGEAAENVEIVVSMRQGESMVSQALLTLSFVPRDARREGQIVFSRTPSTGASYAVESVAYLQP